MKLRPLIVLAAAALVLTGCTATPEPAPTTEAPAAGALPFAVGSIASLGDSVTAGVAACGRNDSCPSASWVVGTDPIVDSLATRVESSTGTAPVTDNFARKGAKITEIGSQVEGALAMKPDLVTVLMGSNDACTRSTTNMTSVEDFQSAATQALGALSTGLPDATIYVSSIPDIVAFFEIERTDAEARSLWSQSGGCNSLLVNPDSDAEEDVNRRAKVGALIDSFNTILGDTCSTLPNCVFDDGALHAMTVTSDDISDVDHFHPSMAGQAKIAAIAWARLEAVPAG